MIEERLQSISALAQQAAELVPPDRVQVLKTVCKLPDLARRGLNDGSAAQEARAWLERMGLAPGDTAEDVAGAAHQVALLAIDAEVTAVQLATADVAVMKLMQP